jgi:hypothetical protein
MGHPAGQETRTDSRLGSRRYSRAYGFFGAALSHRTLATGTRMSQGWGTRGFGLADEKLGDEGDFGALA